MHSAIDDGQIRPPAKDSHLFNNESIRVTRVIGNERLFECSPDAAVIHLEATLSQLESRFVKLK
jgi:hypothetical protein